jgi:hypothetical protein
MVVSTTNTNIENFVMSNVKYSLLTGVALGTFFFEGSTSLRSRFFVSSPF